MKIMCVFFFSFFISVMASEKDARVWDQEKAKKRIEQVLATEKKGTPWEEIKWNTDPKKAVALSNKLGKPIFLYIYVNQGGQKGTNC